MLYFPEQNALSFSQPEFILPFIEAMWLMIQLPLNAVQLIGRKLLFNMGKQLSFFKPDMIVHADGESGQFFRMQISRDDLSYFLVLIF